MAQAESPSLRSPTQAAYQPPKFQPPNLTFKPTFKTSAVCLISMGRVPTSAPAPGSPAGTAHTVTSVQLKLSGPGAEPVVVVFNKASKPIPKGVFAADFHGPTAPSIADTADSASSYSNECCVKRGVLIYPGATRFSRSLGSGPTHIQPDR